MLNLNVCNGFRVAKKILIVMHYTLQLIITMKDCTKLYLMI